MPRIALRVATWSAALLTTVMLSSCYSTSGGVMSQTGGGFTYISTSAQPLTVSVLNTCERSQMHPNGTPFFIMEIPPGKQLTFNFEETGGDDPALRPARMMYAVWDAETSTGSLGSVLSCSPAACRKIELAYRPAPEQRRPDESYRLTIYAGQPATAEAQPRAPRPERTTEADR
jgi:hypothetical protein